jgi:hypothetical protein
MATKTIFVGSSKEKKHLAQDVCNALTARGFTPLPWWTSFPPGQYTFHRILELCHMVDGAVFIFANDDKGWYRDDAVTVPRDNVILEYGVFTAILDPKRCLIVREQESKMPTDLNGLCWQEFQTTDELTSKKIVEHLESEFLRTHAPLRPQTLKLLVDPELSMKQLKEPYPKDWMLRSCYVGLEGAKAWLSFSSDPEYRRLSGAVDVRKSILNLISKTGLDFRTFVSLGPGDGDLDFDIITALGKKEPTLQYIPVDISDGLLLGVCEHLGSHVTIPTGILCDFEDRANFVTYHANSFGRSPKLYGLLGGTFGNLDTNEHRFLGNLMAGLAKDDCLLIDVAINKEGSMIAAKKPDINAKSHGRKFFYSHGAARSLGIQTAEVYANFTKYVQIEIENAPSDIHDTNVVVFSTVLDGKKKHFAYMRRYTLENLTSWLEGNMPVHIVAHERIHSNGPYDRCLLILRKNR